MNCLVTGGAGRLGSEMIRLLALSGYKVKVLDIPLANWEETRSVKGVDFILGDVNDSYIISKASKSVDIVFH